MEITIPDNLNDIPLYQYLNFARVGQEATHQEIEIAALKEFCGISPDDYHKIKKTDLDEITLKVSKALDMKTNFKRIFSHKDQLYGFIPNLDDMTMGEFIDIDKLMNMQEDMGLLMSILYRPIADMDGKRYTVQPYKGKNNDLLDMPTDVALSSLAFFWTIGRDCLNAIQKSTLKTEMQLSKAKPSGKSGAGTLQSIIYAKETLEGSMKLLHSRTINAYYGLPMKPIMLPLMLSDLK